MGFNAPEGVRRIAILLLWAGHASAATGAGAALAAHSYSNGLSMVAAGAVVAVIFYCVSWVMRGFVKGA